MIRGDSLHGRALDDELAAEAHTLRLGGGARAEDWRAAPEAPAEDEPGGMLQWPDRGGAPVGMTADDVAGRSQLARYLQTGRFPADADDIRDMAMAANAPDTVGMELSRLPQGRYDNVTQVWQALGHGVESPRGSVFGG